jgi:hypothetical protein
MTPGRGHVSDRAMPAETPAPARGQADDGLTAVRTTIRPDVDLRVDAAELADLRAQGLLLDDERKGR